MSITRERVLEAASKGEIKIVEQYIKEKGDVNITNDKGVSLLLVCMREMEFNDDLALLLLKNGAARTGTTDIEEYYLNASPLHCAYLCGNKNYKTFKFLLEDKQVDLNATFSEGRGEERLHFDLRLHPGDTARGYTDGYKLEKITLLHYVVVKGDVETAARLCELRANVNATSNLVHNQHLSDDCGFLGDYDVCWDGKTPGALGTVFVCREDIVTIYRCTDVTPLHLAARCANEQMVTLLKSAGASKDAEDYCGETAEDYAEKTQHEKEYRAQNVPSGSGTYLDDLALDSFAKITKSLNEVKIEEKPTKKRNRLFLGENDFSYTRSLLGKHAKKRRLASTITATEYAPYSDLLTTFGPKFKEDIAQLEAKGVTIKFGIDARKIHEDKSLKARQYQHIHFNFPHDRSSFHERTLPELLIQFFSSAAKVQENDDRIYMALPKPKDTSKKHFYQSYVYKIFEASAKSGYVLIKKRKFDAERYPGYSHTKTGASSSADVAADGREYIFKKTPLSYDEIIKSNYYAPGGKKYSYQESNFYLKEIETDPDSSDYDDVFESEEIASVAKTYR